MNDSDDQHRRAGDQALDPRRFILGNGEAARASRRLFIVGAAASVLAGCASGARSTALTPQPTEKTIVTSDELIYQSIAVGAVSGGRESDAVSGSQISSGEFREALEGALKLNGLWALNDPRFTLDAQIEQVDQETFDINLDVVTTVFYRMRDIASGAIVYEKRVIEGFEAQFTDSFVRSERFRLANEGSGRANIQSFIEGLVADFRAEPYRFLGG